MNLTKLNKLIARLERESVQVQRNANLLASVVKNGRDFSLTTDEWDYPISYAFRDAIDLKFTERKKTKWHEITKEQAEHVPAVDKKTLKSGVIKQRHQRQWTEWTQGRAIAFKQGDILDPRDKNKPYLQVNNAAPVGYDTAKGELYRGFVNYTEFHKNGRKETNTLNQFDFLRLVIGLTK